MKFALYCIAGLLGVQYGYASPEVDFDGKNRSTTNVADVVSGDSTAGQTGGGNNKRVRQSIERVSESENVSVPPPDVPKAQGLPYSPYKPTAGLSLSWEDCSNAGVCRKASPEDDWANRGYNRQEYTFSPGATIKRSMNCKAGKWKAKLSYQFSATDEGHAHSNEVFPPLMIAISTTATPPAQWQAVPSPLDFPEMQKNTTYYFWTKLPIFASTINEKFTTTGACAGERTDSVYARYIYMIALPPGDQWYYPDSQPSEIGYFHTDHHYGTQGLVNIVRKIAKEYKAMLPDAPVLRIYDMSLMYGGIIDVTGNWMRPFYGHATGIDADISKWRVPVANRQKLLEIMCKYADTYSEQDVPGQPPYFHIRVPDAYAVDSLDNFSTLPRTTVKCCTGTAINPDVLDVCISTQTAK